MPVIAELTSAPESGLDRPSCLRVSAAGRNGRRNVPPAEGGASGECGEVLLDSVGERMLAAGSEARLWLART